MINIGSRRELFVDSCLVDEEATTAPRTVCRPVKREAAFRFDAPWETHGIAYPNIVRRPDGGYFMYYKSNYVGKKPDGAVGIIRRICVLESADGLKWSRPELTLTPLEIGKVNNIISDEFDYYDNMFVFYDTNPACAEGDRYKAIYGEWGTGIYGYRGGDGINFRFHPEWHGSDEVTLLMSGKDAGCYFDSLNTVYFNEEKGKYIAFVRGFHVGEDNYPPDPDVPEAVRDIRYSESDDFIHWSYPVPFKYNDGWDYQLYANAIAPYYRAPHILLSTPTRYVARPEWNDSFDKLCGAQERRERGRGMSITDAIFMSSRDGVNWDRSSEAVFTPGPEQPRNWVYGDCYPCVGAVETPSDIPGADPYLSLFCGEVRENEPPTLYRYSLRMDGYACRRATFAPCKLVTKPFIYDGSELEINFATSAAGYMKFILACEDGREIHSAEVFGDKIDRVVGFEDGSPADFAGKPVVLRAEMSDASLYSFRFIK